MKSKIDILVYGSLNMDFVAVTNELPLKGETLAAQEFTMIPGGKAANQAVASSRLGSKVGMVGRVGDDYLGQVMKSNLIGERILANYILVTKDFKTGTAMVTVDQKGNNTIVTYKGANSFLSEQDINLSEPLLDEIKATILQLEMDQYIAELIIKKAYQSRKKIILNLAPVVPIDPKVLKLVDVLIVNETEASQLSDIQVNSLDTAVNAIQKIRETGVENIILTLGEKGALLHNRETTEHYPAPMVTVIDSTAAGDCFVAAFTTFWIETNNISEAVKNAVFASALAVTKMGAQASLPTLKEFKEYRKSLAK